VTSTVSGNLLFAAGMTYTASFYMSLLSGSVSGVSPNYQIQEVSGTTFVSGTSLDLSAITSNLTRYSVTRPIAGTGGADRIRTRYGHSIASGQVLNYTIRIASPQLEKGSVATTVIRTASGFVSVDMLGVARDGAPPDFTFTRATTATRVNASGFIESVASGLLRLDYPIGGGCPAGLIEPSAQNFAPNANLMNVLDTPTASGGVTFTTGSTDFLAPDGTSGSINKYVGGAASGSTQNTRYAGTSINVVNAGTYNFSLFVKAGATNPLNFCALAFGLYTGSSGTATSYFSLASGTALTAGASIQDYGNGWYRLISPPYTIASGDVSGTVSFNLASASGSTSFAASGALNLTAYTWGAQVETGAIPTSYIPTTTGSATRAADVCSVSGVSGYIGQTEGTIYAEVDFRNLGYNGAILTLQTDNWITNSIQIQKSLGNQWRFTIRAASTLILNVDIGTITAGIHKIALGYNTATSGTVLAVNGSILSTQTASSIPACNSIVLGTRNETGTFTIHLNDRIRAAAIYTTRLSNDQLANITRLT
jgi:hypothetical protein